MLQATILLPTHLDIRQIERIRKELEVVIYKKLEAENLTGLCEITWKS